MEKRLLCLGYGYVARRLTRGLIADGWAVAGTFRSAGQAQALDAEAVEPVPWTQDGIDPAVFEDATAILVSTPPGDEICPAYAVAEAPTAAKARAIAWVGYLSSNGVYGDHGGDWVDESSPLHASTPRALNRVRAEAQWAAHCAAFALPLVIFRLPGIYGPGRSMLDSVRAGRAQRICKEGQVFSRMHVDDIAAALHASLDNPAAGELFNLADDEPAPPQDVVEFACNLLGAPPPPLVPFEDAALSEMARSFYLDSKRVSNALMKERLGVTLKYPTYREGLRAIFGSERDQ